MSLFCADPIIEGITIVTFSKWIATKKRQKLRQWQVLYFKLLMPSFLILVSSPIFLFSYWFGQILSLSKWVIMKCVKYPNNNGSKFQNPFKIQIRAYLYFTFITSKFWQFFKIIKNSKIQNVLKFMHFWIKRFNLTHW